MLQREDLWEGYTSSQYEFYRGELTLNNTILSMTEEHYMDTDMLPVTILVSLEKSAICDNHFLIFTSENSQNPRWEDSRGLQIGWNCKFTFFLFFLL